MQIQSIAAPLAALLLASGLALAADPPNPQAVERGRKQFKASCGFCHGDDATGSRAPDLIRSPLLNHDSDGELLTPVIRNGRPEKDMPAFPTLTNQQVKDMVAFLHAQALAALHSAHVPRDYPIERLLTGKASEGKAFFNGAGGCSNCHSPTGDLAGIAKKHSPIDLESRFLYPQGAKSKVTVTLPSGQKVDGTLLQIDEFNVSLRDASGWYRSYSRSEAKVDVHDPLEAHRKLLSTYTDADVHNVFAYLETLQ